VGRTSLPWARLGAEFVVIVVGVLVALAFDAWRQDAGEARLGRVHIEALTRDLESDSALLSITVPGLERKSAAVHVLLRDVANIPADSMIDLIPTSANYGWRIPNTRNAAFEEILSTGGLRLIPDADLRSDIVWYYEEWEHQLERLDRHRSGFPNATYEMLPATPDLPVDTAAIRIRLASPDVQDLLRHESNYAALVLREAEELRVGAYDLLGRLRNALAGR
jgi:hypothetical protein